jgi:uncharacterized small protein (DUF1192 family)
VSTDQPTPPREKKPRSTAPSLSSIRVASDEEIRAAAQAEIARIRAEIAQQKKDTQSDSAGKPSKKAPAQAPEAPVRRRATKAPLAQEIPAAPPRTTTRNPEPAPQKEPEPIASAQPDAETLSKPKVPLRDRLAKFTLDKKPTPDFNIKRWEPSPEELELLRAKKIRRLRVAVSIAGAAFVGLLAIIIYLSTGGLVHPTQGVTTEWGTASQVNTLVDKVATPHAGNHVIVHLPGKANKDALVLGFLQGFDGNDYLVTIGADTIVVPREDFVGTVTAIWPSLF